MFDALAQTRSDPPPARYSLSTSELRLGGAVSSSDSDKPAVANSSGMVPDLSRRAVVQLAGLAAAGSLAGCAFVPGDPETEETTETFDAAGAVAVENDNGDVRVEPADDGADAVEVDVTKTTRFGRDRFDDVSLADERDGDRLTVRVERSGSEDPLPRVAVDLVVRLPDGTTLAAASTSNGDVEADGVAGDAELSSANGDVTARDVDGHPTLSSSNGDVEVFGGRGLRRATTSNGDVEVELRSFGGDVDASTTNGDVEISLLASLDADIEAKTSNGRVSVSGLSLADVEQSRNSLSARLGDGGPDLSASSSNGDVEIDALAETN